MIINLFFYINQCDLAEDRWPQLDNFCKENNFSGYFIASAKSGANVNESLHYLVEKVISLFFDENRISFICLK